MGQYRDNKVKFLDSKSKLAVGTKSDWASILSKFNDLEEELSKDLYDFDEEKILSVLDSSKNPLTKLVSIYNSYMNWGTKYFGRIPEYGYSIDLSELIKDSGLDDKISQRMLSSMFY